MVVHVVPHTPVRPQERGSVSAPDATTANYPNKTYSKTVGSLSLAQLQTHTLPTCYDLLVLLHEKVGR
jgi:hypothetical protein